MPDKVEDTIEEMNKAFHDFKERNDKRLAELEKGIKDPLINNTVNKMNEDISALEDTLKAAREKEEQEKKEIRDQIEQLEALLNRRGLGGGAPFEDQKKVEEANRYLNAVREKNRRDPVNLSMEDLQAYRAAFMSYLRHDEKGLSADVRNTLSVGSDPDGGYTVNPDMAGRMATLIQETSEMRAIANVQSIGSDALEGFNDLDEAASGGWVGETQARPETGTPQVGKYRIEAHELYSMPKITQKALDDSSWNLEQWLIDKITRKLTRVENAAFVNGDGVAKPRGFLTYAAGVPSKASWDVIEQVNSGANGAFAASNPGDKLIDLVGKVKTFYRTGARWAMNRATLHEIRKMKDGQGNYLWERDFTNQQAAMLLGYPIQEMEDMPDIAADSLSVAFGNFQEAYQIVDRMGFRILRDNLTQKGFVLFYTTKRTGGDVVNFEAIKIMKFAA